MSSIPSHKQSTRFVNVLNPYVKNSRIHQDYQVDQVVESIKQFGFTNPVLIDEDNTIIAGHCRVLAAKKLDLKEVPCVILTDLTEAQKRAYVIADNKLALNADWDFSLLREEFEALKQDDFNLELTGFSLEELIDILPQEEPEIFCDEDECPGVPDESITKPGDIWLLGNHRLMCGDSTSIDAVEKLMEHCQADLLITDPPYNVSYTGKRKDAMTISNDSMDGESFRQFLADVFTNANIVMRDGAAFYIWHADLEGYNFRGACADVGWQVRQCLVWIKNTLVMGRQDYHWKHEPCLYGWKEGAAHVWNSDRKQTTTLIFDRPTKNDIHPTMKPVELIQYQISNNTCLGDNVLDLFGGSGSTLIACEKLKCKCFMMELDPKYCDVIVKRYEQYTGKKAVLDGGA